MKKAGKRVIGFILNFIVFSNLLILRISDREGGVLLINK